MDATAVAALAALVDHDHARALNQLLHESVELRQQLEQQRQQLEQQRALCTIAANSKSFAANARTAPQSAT